MPSMNDLLISRARDRAAEIVRRMAVESELGMTSLAIDEFNKMVPGVRMAAMDDGGAAAVDAAKDAVDRAAARYASYLEGSPRVS